MTDYFLSTPEWFSMDPRGYADPCLGTYASVPAINISEGRAT